MPSIHAPQKRLIVAALPILLGLALTACSSNSSPSTTNTTAPPTSAPTGSPSTGTGAEPTGGAGAITAIKANWATFFNGSTPIARRVQLLEDGPQFTAAIKGLSKLTIASSSSAKISHVSLTGTSQAAVMYDILISGQPILKNQAGLAIYENGVWKVGYKSFCSLLLLDNAGKKSGLPAICNA
jgi:hypothetical protein